ncbi:hypothetical protein TNCV_3967991 [Trichonephila clavipes]|nr:hypothetical protein TNCV_3967991 [Trichonephila clavipes]
MPQNLLEHVSASYLLLRLVGYQSSWRSTEDFQYTRPHLLGRSLSLVFPRSYGLATDWIRRYGDGDLANVVEVPSAVSRGVKDSLSLSAVAHYMSRTSAVETNRSVVSRSPHICFSWFRWEFLNRSSVFLVTAAYVGRGLVSVDTGEKTRLRLERSLQGLGIGVKDSCVWLTSRWTSSRTIVRIRDQISLIRQDANRYDVWKPFKFRSTNSLLLHIFNIVAPF